MHIGFFSSIVTDGHPTSGYELANEAIVGGLRALGHKVSVIGFRLPRQRAAEGVFPLAVTNLENAEAGRVQKMQWLLKAHLTGLPVAAAKLTPFDPKLLSSTIDKEGPFDLHIINSWQIAAAFPALLEKPFGYISHNVEHITAVENCETAGSMTLRYLYGREARLLMDLETRLCNRASWLWTLSESDLENLPIRGCDGSVLPLVTPLSGSDDDDSEKIVDIGMIGTWTWQANTLGLRWFVEEVLPHLETDLNICVAGAAPKGIAEAGTRVNFLGRVESAADFLSSAHVIALVSRGGTGVQLKTIEAFQAGHACVATSSSLRGVGTLPANCRTSDEAAGFAAALTDLVTASKAGALAKVDGRDFAQHQQNALITSLNEGLTAIASRKPIG